MHLPVYYVCIDINIFGIVILEVVFHIRIICKKILNILIPNTKYNNLVAKFIRFYLIEITLMVPLEFVLATSYDNLS